MEHPSEAARLRDKVDAEAWVARYLSPTRASGRLLEVGCGPLHLVDVAADRLPASLAVGVDRSGARLRDGLARSVTGRPAPVVGEATALPFPRGVFDLSYARFVLQYLGDPQAAVHELVRVTRPGGTVLLQDLDGQLVNHYPEDPQLEESLKAVLGALEGRLDVHVGRKLFTLARRAGLEAAELEMEPYHLIAGTADERTLGLWARKLETAMPAVAQALGERRAESARRRFLAHLRDPESVTFSVLFTVTGRVPSP